MKDKCKCGRLKQKSSVKCRICFTEEKRPLKDICRCGNEKGSKSRRCRKCLQKNKHSGLSRLASLKKNTTQVTSKENQDG